MWREKDCNLSSKFDVIMLISILHTVDFRYLEVQGSLGNTSKYPYLDISDLLNWGKH